MNFKTTYGLFAAFLALIAVAGIWLLTGGRPGDEGVLLAGPRALKLQAKDFDSVTIDIKQPKAETLVFKRLDEKRWLMEKPHEARADSAAVDRLIDDLLQARQEGKVDVPRNLSDTGLADPAITVTLGRKGGSDYKVSLGNVTLGGFNSTVFALSSDSPKLPLAIRKSTLSGLLKSEGDNATTAGDIAKGAADFRSKDLLLEGAGFSPGESVSALKLSDGKHEVELAKQDIGWKYVKPENFGPAESRGDATGASGDGSAPSGVEPLLTALAALKPTANDDFIDNPTDLGQYGLEPGKEVGPKFEITRKGEPAKTETLLIGKKDDASGKVFVRLSGEKAVVKVPEKLLDPIKKLLERPSALREKTLLSFAPTGCDALDVKLPGDDKLLELRKVGDPPSWKLFDPDGTSQLANAKTITELLGALNGKVVKDFPEANASDASLGFDHPAAELTLYVAGILPEEKKAETKNDSKDNEAKDKDKSKDEPKDKVAEKKDDKPVAPMKPKMKDASAKLIFGKRDKDLFYVRRIVKEKDGKELKMDFALSEAQWSKLTKGRLDYIDPTLPSFTNASATKLTFNRGPLQFVVERNADKPGWVIQQPPEKAGRAADTSKIESILGELNSIAALKLWSEKPSERELERYGLKNPKFKAIVTVKDGDKTSDKLYLFGGETDDKSGVYAKQGERDLVFVVGKGAIPSMEAGELQDPLVFRLDAARVTGIKLTGWKDVVGHPLVRELERKGSGNWTLKGDDKIKLSAPQCESLLNALSLVRADSFLPGGPKGEYKLDVAAGALEIQIQLDGEKDPITLTIGAPDHPENKHYYATSSKLPGEVFLIGKGIFEAVKAKPGFFSAE